jgi:hypothetical protein
MDSLKAEFSRGVALLQSIMEEAGFKFAITGEGKSSRGPYLSGDFSKGRKQLSLSVRHTLGQVTYTVGLDTLSHEDYVWAVGVNGLYPGFSEDRVVAFEHLRADLKAAGDAFLNQPDVVFKMLVEKCKATPKNAGFAALGNPR